MSRTNRVNASGGHVFTDVPTCMSPSTALTFALDLMEYADIARGQREAYDGDVPDPRADKREANRKAQAKHRRSKAEKEWQSK